MKKLRSLFIMLALLAGIHQAAAQGTTAFTYQGQLHDGGTNANGTYTMIFNLYDSSTGGNLIGGPVTYTVTLANGLFTVNPDFGAGAFNGSARYLDITVQNGSDSEELSPRVQVLPTPYALYAAVAATVTNAAIMNAQLAVHAVTDTNIVSVSGSKVVGTVALANYATDAGYATNAGSATSAFSAIAASSAASLSATNWSVGVNNFDGVPDVLTIYNDGALRMLVAPYGFLDADDGNQSGIFVEGTSDFDGDLYVETPYNINVEGGDVDVTGNVYAQIVYATGFSTNIDEGGGDEVIVGSAAATSTNVRDILNKVASLPISTWRPKRDPKVHHVGPGAHDFQVAFGLGKDNKTISLNDESGVALAAIQGLNEKLDAEDAQKDAQIKALEKRLSDLEQLVKTSAQK